MKRLLGPSKHKVGAEIMIDLRSRRCMGESQGIVAKVGFGEYNVIRDPQVEPSPLARLSQLVVGSFFN